MEGEHRGRRSGAGRVVLVAGAAFSAFLIGAALVYAGAFGPTQQNAPQEDFIVNPGESLGAVASALASQGYIRSPWIFDVAFLWAEGGGNVRPGGYMISKSMDALTIASQLVAPPYAAWVTVPVGSRKEEIGGILADALGWNGDEIAAWTAATDGAGDRYQEGVYFPDTYFIPTNEPPALIAERMRDRFKEKFAPYADEALKANIPWTRVLTIASLIQRETGSIPDMRIISGIIANRLDAGMPLALDDTLQYMTGSSTDWWPQPQSAGSYPDSPFNTYKRTGLPPHPIDEPGLAAIDAALNPASTDCLFYLHAPNGQLHCTKTYAGQQANVAKYLK